MFLNNQNLRRAGEPIPYTAEQLEEYKRCLEDPLYFIEHHIKILSLDSERLVPFEMRPYQKRMLTTILDNRFTICRFPRQSGKTISAAAICLWFVLFHSNFPILIVANKHDRARAILSSIQKMYEHIPLFLQQGIKRWAKGSVELENGSVIHTAGTSGSAGRGGAYAMVIVDEAAFIPTHIAKEFFESVIPTVSSGKNTKVIATSTPCGLNHFYKLYMDAVSGKNEYVPLEIKWNEVPGRDEKFREGIIKSYGETYFNQEFGAEFLGSSYTLITASKLMALAALRPLYSGPHIQVYEAAQRGRVYVLTTDVSEGVLGDYSTAVVSDVTFMPYRVVCVYRNNTISTMALPQVILNIARTYNEALVMIETTGIGQEVANALLHDLEYENTALTESNSKLGQVLGGMFGGRNSKIGLSMTKKSKAIGCGKLKALIEADQLLIPDADMIDELKRFAVKGPSYAAEEGHDDLVMSLVSLAWMADQGYIRDLTDASARAAVAKNNAQKIEDDLTPAAMFHRDPDPNAVLAVAANDDSWIFSDDEKYWQGRKTEGPRKHKDAWVLEEKKEPIKPPANPLKFW